MTFIFYSAVIGCDEVAVATDRQRHEDQEYSSPRAHCKFNDPGICVFVFALILTMVQDQALVASKHFLVETEDKNLADNAVEPPARWGPRWDRRGQTEDGDDRLWGRGGGLGPWGRITRI